MENCTFSSSDLQKKDPDMKAQSKGKSEVPFYYFWEKLNTTNQIRRTKRCYDTNLTKHKQV